MFDYDVCIVGAGASGLMAAVQLAGSGLRVLVIDKNKKSGTKLYATGNGKCNLGNALIAPEKYYNDPFANGIVTSENAEALLNTFRKIGVPVYDKNGYYYPISNQASTVVWALNEAAKKDKNVQFLFKEEVTKIGVKEKSTLDEYFEITTGSSKLITARKVILAMGGISQKALGAAEETTSTKLLSELSLCLKSFSPALCPLKTKEDVSTVSGVRTPVRVQHSGSGMVDEGELQFTNFGLSGIVIFNLSTLVSGQDVLKIDFLPKVSKTEFVSSAIALKNDYPEKRFLSYLNGYLNDKLCNYFLSRFSLEEFSGMKMKDITKEILEDLYDLLSAVEFTVSVYEDYERAQITKGGILTDSLDSASMRVNGYYGLYAIGEVLNVQGMCGGYNLMFAFQSGILAAMSCLED